MSVRRPLLACLFLIPLAIPAAAQQPTEKPGAADELILQQAKLATDDNALFALLAGRTLQDGDRDTMQKLVEQLGDRNFQVRDRAKTSLVQRGPLAIPFLKKAQPTAPLEMSLLLDKALKEINQSSGPEPAVAAARLLAARTAPKSAALHEKTLKTLLHLLPYVDDDYAEDEILACVARLGLKAGKIDPVLQAALKDPL